MIYRKHTIEKQYLPGADFKMRNGVVVPRKPKDEDLDFVWVTDPDGLSWTEKTVADAKRAVDDMIKLEGGAGCTSNAKT